MRLTNPEAKVLYRAATYGSIDGKSLCETLPQHNIVAPAQYQNAINCLGTLKGNSRDLALVRACDALIARFEEAP
jgi:hypothetical protein